MNKRGPVNSKSLKWSCALHGLLLFLAVLLPLLPVFKRREIEIPVDFTVVLEENIVEPNVPPQPDPPPRPRPPRVVEPVPDAPKPPPLPPPKDAVVVERKPPERKPPERKPPEPKPPVKKPPEKPPEKQPFVKGRRVETPAQPPPKPREDFTKLRPVTRAPVTDQRLSRAEIAKALRDGAKPGARNMIPDDEISRCVLLVRQAMFEAWEQPGKGDAGPRPALLDIRLDATGRVISYRIRQSSGNSFFDQTVLRAAANVAPIRGLSAAFLQQFETLTVEFKLE